MRSRRGASGHHQHAGVARKRGAGAGGARIPPLVRDTQRQAFRHADRPRQHGRDCARHRHRAQAAAPVSTSRRPSTATTPTTRRSPRFACPRAAISTSVSSTTTTATTTSAALPPRRRPFPISASRPSAAGAVATRLTPQASSAATELRWRANDPRTWPRASRKSIFGIPGVVHVRTALGGYRNFSQHLGWQLMARGGRPNQLSVAS